MVGLCGWSGCSLSRWVSSSSSWSAASVGSSLARLGVKASRYRASVRGLIGEEDQKVILAQGGDQGTFGEFEADGHGLAVEPRAQRGDPRVDGLGGVLELEALTLCGASSLEAHIMFGIRPVDPNKGRKGVV